MNFSKLVETLSEYTPNKENLPIRLDKNESPFDIPIEIKREIFEILLKEKWNRYPNVSAEPLKNALAQIHNVSPENIIIGNGSDEILSVLLKIFNGDHAITTPPTFSMYDHYIRMDSIKNVKIFLDKNNFKLPTERIIAKTNRHTKAVFISNPNNPTGNGFPEEDIRKIINTGVPVVIDEAYIEFSKRKSFISEAVNRENVIVLRTFSKAFSLAGIRVGYAISNKPIIERLHKVKSPFSVNRLSMQIAIYLLSQDKIIKNNIRKIIQNREILLQKLPKEITYKSETNFILVHANAFSFLKKKGILVRNLNGILKNHVRITVGNKAENEVIINAFEEFIKR